MVTGCPCAFGFPFITTTHTLVLSCLLFHVFALFARKGAHWSATELWAPTRRGGETLGVTGIYGAGGGHHANAIPTKLCVMVEARSQQQQQQATSRSGGQQAAEEEEEQPNLFPTSQTLI